MHFFTSINNNYFAKARVLAKSIKQYCKNVKFSLILSDKRIDNIDWSQEPFDEVLTVEELGIPTENLLLWIYMHTTVELCTAVKGQALVRFLEEGSQKVIYLDPDIVVFNHLDEIEQMLDNYDVLLTPHQSQPEITKENIINNEITSLRYGIYNFGFFAARNSENGLKIARWWRDRLVSFCYDDIPNGLFTDQRWGDLMPALFEGVHILREPEYNVSTWNITTRQVSKIADVYTVDGRPLKFYHFSGFDSGAQLIMLNKHSKGNPILYELRDWYIKRQFEEGQQDYYQYPSIYDYYDNGERITKDEREVLRKRQDVLDYFAQENPYIVEQIKSYYHWYRIEINRDNHKENLIINYIQTPIDYFLSHNRQQELQRLYHLHLWDQQCYKLLNDRFITLQKQLAQEHAAHQQTKNELYKEHAAHQQTKNELYKEHAVHQQTKNELYKEHAAHQQTKNELYQEHIAHTATQAQLCAERTLREEEQNNVVLLKNDVKHILFLKKQIEEQLYGIENSKAWRAVQLLRKIKNKLFRR